MKRVLKHLLSLLLCVALFMEFCPLDALAAGNIASESALETAWALSGQDPNAAHWHRGMTPEATWNAEQLDEWLDYVLDEVLYSVHNAHSDMKVTLDRMADSAPETYNRLMSGTNGLYMEYMTSASHQVEDLRQQLRAYKTIFIMNADKIAGLIDDIRDDSVCERDKIRYSRQLEAATEAIRENRAEVVQNYKGWLQRIDAWHADFTGEANSNAQALFAAKNAGGSSGAGLSSWVKDVMSWHEAPIKTTVSVELHPDGRNNSVLAKLSSAHSALAAQESDTQTIHVIPDTQFVVNLNTPVEIVDPSNPPDPAPSPMPIQNGKVTVWDAKDVRYPDTVDPYTTAAVTEINGDATFNVSEFTVDEDGFMRLGIVAQADGYRTVKHYVAEVQKGGVYDISLAPDGSVALAANNAASPAKPYFYDFEFNRRPALGNEALIYYSPLNNVIADIVAGVVYPAGYTGSKDVTLKYYDVNGTDPDTGKKTGAWVTATVKGSDAEADPEYKGSGTGMLYTFSKKWNMILKPGETVDCYVGAESDGLKADDIMLTVKRGAVDEPMVSDSGTGALTGISDNFKGLGNLFQITLPSDLRKPLGGSSLSLNIPILEYLPKISYDIDGTLTVAYGIDPGITRDKNPQPTFGPQPSGVPAPTPAPQHWYDDRSWRSTGQRERDAKYKDAEGKATYAQYKAAVGSIWDGLIEKNVDFLGSAKFSMGAFGMITGQFGAYNEHKAGNTAANGDTPIYYNCRDLNLTLGAIATFTAQATWQFSLIGYFSVGFSASLAIGLTVGGEWYNFDPVNSNFGRIQWSGASGLTVMVKLMVSITLGAGVKGVLSLSVTGYGYINMLITWTKATGPTPWLKITLGAGVTACVEVLWLKWTFEIWKLPEEVVLLDTHKSNTVFNMLDVYAAPALAEGDDDDAPEAMTPLEPEYYPALVPEATQVMDDVSMQNTNVKYADLGDTTFAFYIAAAGNGKDRLTWRNLKTGKTGNVQAALDEIAEYEIKDEKEDPYRVASKNDYAFDVIGEINRREGLDLGPTLMVAVLCTSALKDEIVDTENGSATVKAPTDSFVYYLMLVSDGEGGLKTLFFDHDIPQFPQLGRRTRHGFLSQALDFPCGGIDLSNYALSAVITGVTLQWYVVLLTSTAKEYIPHNEDNGEDKGRAVNTSLNLSMPTFLVDDVRVTTRSSDIPLLSGNTARTQVRSGYPAGPQGTCTTWYALESAGADGPATLVHGVDPAGGGDKLTAIREKDSNDDVVFYMPVRQGIAATDRTDQVFYLTQTADDDGEHHWLKRAGVTTHADNDNKNARTTAYTVTDYDIEVKAGSFNAQNISGVTYIYWLATAQKEKETDPDVYRIKSVVYDPSSDAMSNELVLAEFSMPEAGLVPANLFLSENGTGYCTAVIGEGDNMRADVYSFPVNWITSLELNAMTLSDTHTNPASWLDTVVSVMNSGNTGISRFDLELYTVADDGTETVVERLHCDCLNKDNNAIYEGSRLVSTGDHTILRLEDAVKPMQQPNHNVTRQNWTHDDGFSDGGGQYLESAMLLPGGVNTYSMPLYIPADWEDYKTLFLRVATTATRANWLAANAAVGTVASNGVVPKALMAASDDALNPEIVYSRQADGTMVRTDNVNEILLEAKGAGRTSVNATSLSPLYPDTVKGTEPLALNHDIHDLSVSHRVYRDANGYEYIAITFLNQADTGKALELNALIYMDGETEPYELALPYYPDKTTDSYTHTVTVRLDDLLGGRHPRNAKVVIEPDGVEETALRNNQFTLHFDDEDVDDPLRFTVQPSPVSAQPGETVTFTVEVTGGVKPYTYQWQVWMGEKLGWKNIPDSNSPTLTVENITAAMHGRKARCIVTDHYLTTIFSDEAMLTVIGAGEGGENLPETGDDTNLPLYIAVALIALTLLWWIRRREKSM